MAGHWPEDFFDAIAIEDEPIDEPFLVEVEEEEQEDEDEEEDEEEEDEGEDEDDEEENQEEDEMREDGDEGEAENRRPWLNPSMVSGIGDTVKDSKSVGLNSGRASSNAEGDGVDCQKEWNREEVEGLCCPICMEPWCNSGDHQPSCLTCGHLFGMSCIKKWLGQRTNSGKCPQCNRKSTLKDVRRIYGSQVVVVDEESQKRIRYLEAKCESLEKMEQEWKTKEAEWQMKVHGWQKREADLCKQLELLTRRTSNLERALGDLESKSLGASAAAVDGFRGQSARGNKVGITCSPTSSYIFVLQQELLLDGARHFDVDHSGQVLIVARRPTRIGGSHILTKMSLFSPQEQDNMQLPSTIKAVRDLHVSPFGRLALLASMGKKLSLLSMETNNVVVNCDLPAAAWSCSWDVNSSHFVYAGLQNGMVLVFDLRQTVRPLDLRNGLTCNPVHTIYSLSDDSTVHSGLKRLLTASSVGLCHWNISDAHEQPILITDTVNQGVCISLAYCPSGDDVVATFRPKVEMPNETSISQLSQAPSSDMAHHVQGSHVLVKRLGSIYQKLGSTSANVPGIRLPKSTILELEDSNSAFACGDEATSNLVLRGLPSLTFTQFLQSYHPIRDMKYTASQKPGVICCLAEDRMQFFSQKFL